MTSNKPPLTQAQKAVIKFFSRPIPGFEAKSAEDAAAVLYANAKAGDRMPDGTICAGISPLTKKPFYAAPEDVFLTLSDAAHYAENLEIGGAKGFRIPAKEELHLLYLNQKTGALKGTFNAEASYWSATAKNGSFQWAQRFSDGGNSFAFTQETLVLRCVR